MGNRLEVALRLRMSFLGERAHWDLGSASAQMRIDELRHHLVRRDLGALGAGRNEFGWGLRAATPCKRAGKSCRLGDLV